MAEYGDNEAANSRIEKVEHDMMLLQRQVSRSGGGNSSAGGSAAGGGSSADLEVRLSAIEEQMRALVGKAEENAFQNKKLAETIEKIQKDNDFRFNEITAQKSKAEPIKDTGEKPKEKSVGKTVDTADDSEEADASNNSPIKSDFATPREHYNYAFGLLDQMQYDKSAASFAAFAKKYPKDPLIGNAYYWMGKTYYIKRDYVKAADSFRQGFEALPSGSKAPDNLLDLAMSLNALKRDKEACIVLTQVVAKFNKTSTTVAQKAVQEQKRIGCQ